LWICAPGVVEWLRYVRRLGISRFIFFHSLDAKDLIKAFTNEISEGKECSIDFKEEEDRIINKILDSSVSLLDSELSSPLSPEKG